MTIIGLLEYARMRLPAKSSGLITHKLKPENSRRSLNVIFARSGSVSVSAVASASPQPTASATSASAYLQASVTLSSSISALSISGTVPSTYVENSVTMTASESVSASVHSLSTLPPLRSRPVKRVCISFTTIMLQANNHIVIQAFWQCPTIPNDAEIRHDHKSSPSKVHGGSQALKVVKLTDVVLTK